MNLKQIKELAQLLKQNDLSALEVNEGDTRIRLERTISPAAQPSAPVETAAQAPVVPMPQESAISVEDDPGVDFNHVSEMKSPLVGVFYAAPAPGAKPFVSVGSKVKKGDVLCIVEAMKLMNEIQAEQDGEIVDICVRDGDIVEFGQTLFKLY